MRFRMIVLLLVGATLGLLMIWSQKRQADFEFLQHQKEVLGRQSSIGNGEDPEGRMRWEFDRLHSPVLGAIPEGIRAKELAFAATLPIKEHDQFLAKGQAYSWTYRGPRNVGGRTRALAIDVANPNIILAGGVSGGMWRSTDDGASWAKTSDPTHLHSVSCLAQDTKVGQTSTWYYGTGEYISNSADGGGTGAYYKGDGIFKSTDNGISWAKLPSTSTNVPQTFDNYFDYCWKIAVDTSSNPSKVYVATFSRIYRSTDGGSTWSIVLDAPFPNYALKTDVVVTSVGEVYVGMSGNGGTVKGIYRSATGAAGSFVNITPAGFPTSFERIVLAVAPSNQNVVYSLVENTNGTEGVNQINGHQIWKYTYITGDGSGSNGTWVNKGASLPNEPFNTGFKTTAVFDSQGGYDLFIAVKPDNENSVIIGGVNLYKTADFSVATPAWTRMGGYSAPNTFATYLNHHPDIHSGMFLPGSNVIFYSGHDGGITKTANVTATPVVWSVLNNDYVTSQFYTIAIDHGTSGNAVIVGGTQDNGTWWTNSTSSAVNWIDQFSGDGAYAAIADGRTSYYFSSQNGNTYRVLMDGSGNWTDYANVTPSGASGFQFINPFILDPNNTNMMYMAGGSTVWRNSDLTAIPTFTSVGAAAQNATSTNWSQMTNTSVGTASIVALAVSKTPSNRLYYASYEYTGTDVSALYRVDGANTGDPVPTNITGAGFPSAFISCITVNPSNADEVLVVFSNYEVNSLFHSTDGGSSWTNVSGNLEQTPPGDGTGDGPSCRWASIVPTTGGTVYFVATSTGLYSASSLGTWVQEGATTIGNVVCDMIDFRTSDGLVVVATHGNGVYSATVLGPTSVAQGPENVIPFEYKLSQNFPNPFNPGTTIQYKLPDRAHVNISVFDIAGREVSVLFNGEKGAGTHEVYWNATDSRGLTVSSGVYFYRILAFGDGNEIKFARTEKMTYVK